MWALSSHVEAGCPQTAQPRGGRQTGPQKRLAVPLEKGSHRRYLALWAAAGTHTPQDKEMAPCLVIFSSLSSSKVRGHSCGDNSPTAVSRLHCHPLAPSVSLLEEAEPNRANDCPVSPDLTGTSSHLPPQPLPHPHSSASSAEAPRFQEAFD